MIMLRAFILGEGLFMYSICPHVFMERESGLSLLM